MTVGPSIPTPMMSNSPGTPARLELLVDDHLVQRPEPLPAVVGRPRDRGEPGLGQAALPLAVARDGLVLVLDRAGTAQDRRLAGVLVEPAAHLGAVLGELGGVVEVHSGLRW